MALRALVDALATPPDSAGGAEITAADWAEWLSSDDAAALQGILPDGRHDAPLVSEAALMGLRREFLGGRLESPGLHYRLWMEAMAESEDPQVRTALHALATPVAIGARVIEVGELTVGEMPVHESPHPIVAPPAESYERLREAVRLPTESLEDYLPHVEMLQRTEGSDPWRPLSRESEDTVLVADPWGLSLAGLVRAVRLAASSPELFPLLERMRDGAKAVVINAIEEMEWKLEAVEEDHLVASPDVDLRVVVGIAVFADHPERPIAETFRAEAELFESYERMAALARSLGADHSLLAMIGDGRTVEVSHAHPALHASELSDPWLVGIPEMQVIGEALRLDPLALPTALTEASRPPWPPHFDLLDEVGTLRYQEEGRRKARQDPVDGTEYMLARARLAANRQTTFAPDLTREIEVSRWEGIEDPAIFRSRESDQFALCVLAPARCFWITCPATLEQRYELLPTIAAAFAFWLARLYEAGFLLAPAAAVERLFVRLDLELDRRPGPQLAIVEEEESIRIVLGPGFVAALCRGDNDADRMFVGAMLAWWRQWEHPKIPMELDEIVPPGRGTALVWPDPEALSNPPRLERLPPVEERARRQIERALASRFVPDEEVLIGSGARLQPFLEELARRLEGLIQANGKALEPAALRDLVALHERGVFQAESEAISLPGRDAIRGAATYPGPAEDLLYRDLALRILVERFAALPPQGAGPLSRRAANGLRAAVELQLELLGALETIRWEGAGGEVFVSPRLGVVLDLESRLLGASDEMRSQMTAAAPDLMVEQHDEWWGEQPNGVAGAPVDAPFELEGKWQELDLIMGEEWGVGFEQMLRVLKALAAAAEGPPDCVATSSRDLLEEQLARQTGIQAKAVAAAVDRLTLGPCPEYDAEDEEHHPGVANRERSYMRRPLVQLADGGLCWSSLHCRRSARYFANLIESGRLRGSRRLRNPVIWISQELDLEFEGAVMEAVLRCGWQARGGVTRLAGKQLRRNRKETIGDIDVLAWSTERREVWLLDAKRLIPGVAPGPMLREGTSFAEYARRHEERLSWVVNHLPELAREIGAGDVSEWQVRAALVLDRPLAGAYLGNLSMPIWTIWSLPGELDAAPVGSDEAPSEL